MSKDRYLDWFLFCSILEDDEPSAEKEKAYRKYIGAAFDDNNVLVQAIGSYTFKSELLSDTLKAILSDYSECIYSSFFNSNRQLFLDSIFGTHPDLMIEAYQPNQAEKTLIKKIFNAALYPFSLLPNRVKYVHDKLFDLFYLSPKFMKQVVKTSGIAQEHKQQILYSILFKDSFSFEGALKYGHYYEDCVFPTDFVHNLISYCPANQNTFILNYKNSFPQKDDASIAKWAEEVSYILNNEHFQELTYYVCLSLAKNISEYSNNRSTGFRRMFSILKKEQHTPELYDSIFNSLKSILTSNYHPPIGATHPLLEISFENRRDSFDEMINVGLIKRQYDNPVRSMLYVFCIRYGLFTPVLAKALIRETSATVVEKIYDTLFFKNKNSDGIKVVQRLSSEEEFEQILSCLVETKHSTALRIFAKGAPLKYLTRAIGQDKYADETISQRFEAGK